MTSVTYVYAIRARGASLPSEIAGFQHGSLFTVPHGDLEAVVSEIDRDMLRMTEETVLLHEAVVEAVQRMGPSIPVRFGTLMPDPAAVANALRTRYRTLLDDLERVGDKVELGLTVLWRQPVVEDTAEPDDASEAQSPGTRYLRARYSQYRHDAALRDRAGEVARELNGELPPCVLERRCTLLPTPQLMLRAAYLMRPSDVPGFQAAFAELPGRHGDLRFLLTGPWPPYSFVTAAELASMSALAPLLDDMARELDTAFQG